MAKHKNSSKEKWLIEGKKIVVKKGVEAINIDEISKKIGVAKTSFYHFFRSKSNFLEILFQKGIEDGTDRVIKLVHQESGPWNRIEKLIHTVVDHNSQNELFLRGLRTYGLHNKKTLTLIRETELKRMQFLKGLLLEAGLSENEAEEKSQYFYLYTLGLYEHIYANPHLLDDKQKIYDRMLRLLKI